MIEELLKLTETLDYEENGGFSIAGVTRKDSTDLELHLKFDAGDDVLQNWSLLCRFEREHHIKLGSGTHIDVTDDHVLLWPYIRPRFSLWFTGSTESAPTVVGELWQANQELVGKALPFSRFINYAHDLEGLIAGGHGKLAEAPEPLISTYENILQMHGFKTSRPLLRGEGVPAFEPGKIRILILADSYVIANAVEARRTD